MRHKYYNDGFDAYEEVKNESISIRGRTMSGFDAHKEEVAPKKESREPTWKQGIPTVAGRYFYADDIKNLDIPRYCTVTKGESWGGPDIHCTYIEIYFIEPLGYKKIKFVKSDKRKCYVDVVYNGHDTVTNTILNEG